MAVIKDQKCTNPECTEYGKVYEMFIGIHDIPNCKICSSPMGHVFSPTTHVVYKGQWFKNTGKY